MDTLDENAKETKEGAKDESKETKADAPAAEEGTAPEAAKEEPKETKAAGEKAESGEESADESGNSEAEDTGSKDEPAAKGGLPVHLQPKMGYPSTSVPELIRIRETERAIRHRLRKAPNAKAAADVREYFTLFVEHVEEVLSEAEAAIAEKAKAKADK